MSINPELLISDYFDSLIREVDIFIEERLLDVKSDSDDDDLISSHDVKGMSFRKIAKNINHRMDFQEVEDFLKNGEKKVWADLYSHCFYFEKNHQTKEQSRSMKPCDYWNDMRDEMFGVLYRLQKDTFEHYETIRDELKWNISIRFNKNSIESILPRVFKKRFAFILKYENSFSKQNIHLIELDFYLNSNECQLLNYFLKCGSNNALELIFASLSDSKIQYEHLDKLNIDQNGMFVYTFAKYLLDLFSPNDFHSICRVIRIFREDLFSHRQIGLRLYLKAINTTIDLNKPATPKIDLSKIKHLMVYFAFNQFNNFRLDFAPLKNSNSNIEFLNIHREQRFSPMFLSKNFFTNLQSIRSLQLTNCDFSYVVNDALQSMRNLEALGLKQAKNMSHIELKGLVKLKWLRLELGQKEIPLFDQVNPDLQVLEFNLMSFSSDFKSKIFENISNLKAFLFSNTYPFEFDLDWIRCKPKNEPSSLTHLRLTNLRSLKGDWSSFENLRTLDLSESPSIELQFCMFFGLTNLKSLDISSNKNIGDQLVRGLFNGLVNLEQLNMKECNIKSLPDGLFSPLGCLKVLDLSKNFIVRINSSTFIGLKHLKELRFNQPFHDNQCDFSSAFIHFKKLEKLILNPLFKELADTIKVIIKFPDIEITYENYIIF